MLLFLLLSAVDVVAVVDAVVAGVALVVAAVDVGAVCDTVAVVVDVVVNVLMSLLWSFSSLSSLWFPSVVLAAAAPFSLSSSL